MEPLLLLVAQILEVRVDDLAFLRTRRALARPAGRAGRLTLRLRLAVHDLRELVGRAGQVLLGALHPLEVLALQRLARLRERVVDRLAVGLPQLGSVLPERPLRGVHERVGLVADFDFLLPLRVFRRVALRLLHHPVDFVLGQARRGSDGDVLLLAGRLILRRNVQDAVRVDIERHFDLRHLARRRRDADEMELPQGPVVSPPTESGVTSSKRRSFTSPVSTAPCTAAPTATTSSGLTPLCGSLPKSCFTASCTFGMRVWPPTRMTSLMSFGLTPASCMACRQGPRVRSTRSATSASSLARVSVSTRCLGPLASAVMKGRLISVCSVVDSSHFAFSADSFNRWSAMRSFRRSIPCSFLNSSEIQSMTR